MRLSWRIPARLRSQANIALDGLAAKIYLLTDRVADFRGCAASLPTRRTKRPLRAILEELLAAKLMVGMDGRYLSLAVRRDALHGRDSRNGMLTFPLKKPRLPSHFYIRFEPPDRSGDEVLLFQSERRKIKLKGTSFREFIRYVIPLLDGTRTLTEIQTEVGTQFGPGDLERCLTLLTEYKILQDAEPDTMNAEVRSRIGAAA